MRNIVIVVFTLISWGFVAQTTFSDPFAPIIKFDNETYDFGSIKKGADGSCEFKFKNEGQDPLIIDRVEPGCACVVTKWPKRPIRKGRTGKIKVKYYTERVGPIDKYVTIRSNSQTGPIILKLKGNIGG
ncbi:MAG: DUF1573 domain-containing protein [Bacteroidetes bacterium]|nr:DUF1573 domain-containing protein [Bacteroidota bacterium]